MLDLPLRLNNAEESYESAYRSLEASTEEDEDAYADFLSSLDDQRARVDHLKLLHTAHAQSEDLLEVLEYWEDLNIDDLKLKVKHEIDSLQSQFDQFVDLTRFVH